MCDSSDMVVLITGAASGLGRLLAERMHSEKFKVLAAMRDTKGKNEPHLKALTRKGMEVLDMDVRKSESVQRAVRNAISLCGRVDVLVNNAGIGMRGPLEAVSIQDLRTVLETNLFGPHRVIQALLPAMRLQGSGLLVHISSGAGRISIPGRGAYCISKWALETMGEVLRYELSPWGIDSIIVEPGRYKTKFDANSLDASKREVALLYKFLRSPKARSQDRGDPNEVVETILRLVRTPRGLRPTRTRVAPAGSVSLDVMNREQSALMMKVISDLEDPKLLENGI